MPNRKKSVVGAPIKSGRILHKNCTIDRDDQTLLICEGKKQKQKQNKQTNKKRFTVSEWRPVENF